MDVRVNITYGLVLTGTELRLLSRALRWAGGEQSRPLNAEEQAECRRLQEQLIVSKHTQLAQQAAEAKKAADNVNAGKGEDDG